MEKKMARIAGVNIPTNKRVIIALTYIHGIGKKFAKDITAKVGIPDSRRVSELSDAEVLQIREAIDQDYQVEGDLDEHQASAGSGLLPRPSSPQGPADTRSAHAHQCPHPQGSGQGDRWEEEVIWISRVAAVRAFSCLFRTSMEQV
jgi:hypothetical protein